MKILFTRFPLESAYGGAEVQTLSLMEGLIQHGHAVAFLGSCEVLLRECRERGIPTVELNIGAPPVTKWAALSFLWRKKSMQRSLFQYFSEFHDLDAVCMLSLSEKILLSPIAIKKNVKPFWIEHDRVGSWLSKNPSLPILRDLSKSSRTIVVSDLSKKLYEDLGWKNIIAIPNGIKAPHLHTEKRSTERGFHIGCIARLTEDKGVDVLLEAMRDFPDCSLTIVGSGRDENIIFQMAETMPNVTIRSRVTNLSEVFASIDILVLPSREHDPFGLVAAEAMLLGIPVVVTDACGIASYLEHEKDALVVRAGSAAALKDAITTMKKNPELRQMLAKNGKEKAEKIFSIERMVDAYEQVFSQ